MCEALASLVFPAPCRICARILDTGSAIPFCRSCMEALTQTLREPLCAQCGRPIVSAAVTEGISQPLCHLCRSGVYAFDFARSFGAYTPTTGAAAMNVTFNLASTTQYGNTFGVTSVTQNGYTTGQLSGVSVSSTGVVQANYTNGQSTALGQVAVANFADQQGLQQVANTNWVQTFASGQPVYGQAGGAGVGNIESGSLEQSNVDITAQLVNMITAQRAFQANAEMVSTENAITQTTINIPNQQ